MCTLVKLYNTDGTTILEEDKKSYGGVAAKMIWTAPDDGTYYLTVEHGSAGTGNFAISARQTQPYDEVGASDTTDDSGDGGDDDHGGLYGCFIGTAAYGFSMK